MTETAVVRPAAISNPPAANQPVCSDLVRRTSSTGSMVNDAPRDVWFAAVSE